jgi:hypothetical protein
MESLIRGLKERIDDAVPEGQRQVKSQQPSKPKAGDERAPLHRLPPPRRL